MIRRKKRSRLGPHLKAEAAVHEAEGVLTKSEIARTLGIGRETLRLLHHGADAERYESWIAVARRRLALRVPRREVLAELLEMVEPAREPEPATPEEQYDALRSLASQCGNPDRILGHVAERIGVDRLGPDRPQDLAEALKVLLDLIVSRDEFKENA